MRASATPGTYVLVVELDRPTRLTIGQLGTHLLAAGSYLYVGSALNGLRSRLARHMRKEKRLHWHIDYLLQVATVAEVWSKVAPERLECAWAEALRRSGQFVQVVRGFGSSDCRCWSHLFYSVDRPRDATIVGNVDVAAVRERTSCSACASARIDIAGSVSI